MKKILLPLFYTLLAAGFLLVLLLWIIVLRENVKNDEPVRIYLPTGSDFSALTDTLESADLLRSRESFIITSRLKSFGKTVKPGSYIIEPGMSNNSLVNMLRSGRQAPVNVTFNNIRTLDELAGKTGGQIEADSASLSEFFHDESNYSADGYNTETVIAVFIPDTYELYWTVDPRGFYRRMLKEYRDYWNDDRTAKAEAQGLTPPEVSVLASIVDEEASREDEKPRIAGVYINRLRLGMPLQADPTVKFAVNDFTLRRVLNKHVAVDSPYNTYKFAGLPPGPIRCPSRSGLDAVLNAEKHEYLFFVAKYDGSGYHHFSRTLAEHNRYAVAYWRELNRRRIYK
ncbi:MAG TPA: endolytic transglycosylase MltG [Bacteroidales bacterium]|nr:endolytic transglycosylase MltG [Bacteroidales bacterium]